MRTLTVAAVLVVALAGSAAAQATIDPGMTKQQVIAKLGKPASEHSKGSTTYLYYRNGQEKKMGMSDMVALDNDKVVDAVFRSSRRKYSGKSSSPAPVPAAAAIAKGKGDKPLVVPKADSSRKSTPTQTKRP